jgi:23S rRNA (uracil1939-C5)-methyltransferase
VDLAENLPGDERVCHLELAPGADPERFTALAAGLQGLTARVQDASPVHLAGSPTITDVLHGREGDPSTALRLRRDVRSFFQSNRFLLAPLVRHVLRRVPDGPVLDLYAGVGLFGLSLAAAGHEDVMLVEGDETSGRDLARNAEPLSNRAAVEPASVERFLASLTTPLADATVIVDPPRTGLSRHALAALVRLRPRRIVYVSCDVPTLARDARAFMASGYDVSGLTGFDLFPNTAHVETVCVFDGTAR